MKKLISFLSLGALMGVLVASLLFMPGWQGASHAPKVLAPSPKPIPTSPVLVELFTSEGCSSCPSAEALLQRMSEKYPANDLISLEYHVDYWDYLGWKDPYASASFTARQRSYAQQLGLESVFTPQAIVNGKLSLVGSDERGLTTALQQAKASSAALSLSLQAQLTNGQAQVRYQLQGTPAGAQLVLVSVQPLASQAVPKGENAGRTLHHHNIVRSLTSMPASATGTAKLTLPAGATQLIGIVTSPQGVLAVATAALSS